MQQQQQSYMNNRTGFYPLSTGENEYRRLQDVLAEILSKTDTKTAIDHFCRIKLLSNENVTHLDNIIDDGEIYEYMLSAIFPKLVSKKIFCGTLQTFSQACGKVKSALHREYLSPMEGNVARVLYAIGVGAFEGEVNPIRVNSEINENTIKQLDTFIDVCSESVDKCKSTAVENEGGQQDFECLKSALRLLLTQKFELMEIQHLIKIFSVFGWLNEMDFNSFDIYELPEKVIDDIKFHILDIAPVIAVLEMARGDHCLKQQRLNQNKLLRYWTFLKQNLDFWASIDWLIQKEFIDINEQPDKSMPRESQFIHLMPKIVKHIQTDTHYEEFLNICIESGQDFIAQQLEEPYHPPKCKTADHSPKDELYRMKMNRKNLENNFPLTDAKEAMIDHFVECGLILCNDYKYFIQNIETIEAVNKLLDLIERTINKRSYHCFKMALENAIHPVIFRSIQSLLDSTPAQQTPQKDDVVASVLLQKPRLVNTHSQEDKPDKTTICLEIRPENESSAELETKIIARQAIIKRYFIEFFFCAVKEVLPGSIIVHLISVMGSITQNVGERMITRHFESLLEGLFSDTKITDIVKPGEYTIHVTQKTNESTLNTNTDDSSLVEQTYNVIPANKSFLVEEISPMFIIGLLKNRGLSSLDMERIMKANSRRERAELLLNIIEEDASGELQKTFLEILKERKMSYILDHLNYSKDVLQAIDVSVVRENIMLNISALIDEIDLNDIWGTFVDRKIIDNEHFESLVNKYPDSRQDRVITVLNDILLMPDIAVLTMVEALNRRNMSSLVKSLLNNSFQYERSRPRSSSIEQPGFGADYGFDFDTDDDDQTSLFDIVPFHDLWMEQEKPECQLRTVLLINIAGQTEDYVRELKAAVFKYIDAQIEDTLPEHIATVIFGKDIELLHHFRRDLQLVKYLNGTISVTDDGPSYFIQALEYCRELLQPEESAIKEECASEKSYSRVGKFHPRIIFFTNDNFHPKSVFANGVDGEEPEFQQNLWKVCEDFRRYKIEINCVEIGEFLPQLVQMYKGYPTDPLHFLAKATCGKIVLKDQTNKLGSERTERIMQYFEDQFNQQLSRMQGEEDPTMMVLRRAMKEKITNIYKVKGMLRDEGIEMCDNILASLMQMMKGMIDDD